MVLCRLIKCINRRPFKFGIGTPVIVFGGAYLLLSCLSDSIRWAGMVMQLAGMSTAALDIYDLRRKYKKEKKSFVEFINARWRLLVGILHKQKEYIEEIKSGILFGGGAEFKYDLPEQVHLLQTTVLSLTEKLDASISEFEKAGAVFDAKIEDVAVGGNKLEIIGVIWLVLGIIGTSIPTELARFIESTW